MTIMLNTITIGSRVKVVNFHGEDFHLTAKLSIGYVREFYVECGERRALVFFPRYGQPGGWPVEMLREVA